MGCDKSNLNSKITNLETLEDGRSKSKVVIIHKALNSNLEIEQNKTLLQPSDKYRVQKTLSLFHMQGQMRTNTLSSRVALEHGLGCLIRPGKPIT